MDVAWLRVLLVEDVNFIRCQHDAAFLAPDEDDLHLDLDRK
jgi:hypothetical protein